MRVRSFLSLSSYFVKVAPHLVDKLPPPGSTLVFLCLAVLNVVSSLWSKWLYGLLLLISVFAVQSLTSCLQTEALCYMTTITVETPWSQPLTMQTSTPESVFCRTSPGCSWSPAHFVILPSTHFSAALYCDHQAVCVCVCVCVKCEATLCHLAHSSAANLHDEPELLCIYLHCGVYSEW